MLLLGVSSCFMYPDSDRKVFGPKYLNYMEQDMARYLHSRDVLPVLIPNIEEDAMDKYLDQVSGIVFQGGTDISPQTYGADPVGGGRWPGDAERDQYELKLMEKALEKGLPVFGICRGFQLLNVKFGGTLFQDLTLQKPGTRVHRDAQAYDQVVHQVDLTPGGLFEEMYGSSSGWVTSVHHQGIQNLARDLRVEAVSPDDGLIEAFSGHVKAPIIGVQWHPEFHYNYQGTEELLSSDKLYSTFLDYCLTYHHEHH